MKSSRKTRAAAVPILLLFGIMLTAGCDEDKAWETADSQTGRSIMSLFIIDKFRTFTVGGTVTLNAGVTSVVLQNNGADDITITASGTSPFTFSTRLHRDATYSVSATPSSGSCTLANESGTIVNSNITNISVVCDP